MYPSAQLSRHKSNFWDNRQTLSSGCELHTDTQKDHCSPGSQHEKHLPKGTLLTSCQGMRRNDTMTDRVTSAEWQVWKDKCGMPHNRDWFVGNAPKTPNPHKEEEQTASTKAVTSKCPIPFPDIHQSQSHIPDRQGSNSGVTYIWTSFGFPRGYLFYSWGSYSVIN